MDAPPIGAVESKIENAKLKGYRRELIFKVVALALFGMANMAAVAYAGYRLYNVAPLSWTKALIYTPLIAGLVLTIIIYKKMLTGNEKLFRVDERNVGSYNLLLLFSCMLSFGAFGPFVAVASQTDLTNYAWGTKAEATADRLRNRTFQELAHTEFANYNLLIRLGFIQEGELQNFNVAPEGMVTAKDNETISVKIWLKKALSTLKTLEAQLQDTEVQAKKADSSVKLKSTMQTLNESIQILNDLWKKKAKDLSPIYTGGGVGRPLTFFERHFLKSEFVAPPKEGLALLSEREQRLLSEVSSINVKAEEKT